jgi:hypothetical protein
MCLIYDRGFLRERDCFNLDCNSYKKQRQSRVIWNEVEMALIKLLPDRELSIIVNTVSHLDKSLSLLHDKQIFSCDSLFYNSLNRYCRREL